MAVWYGFLAKICWKKYYFEKYNNELVSILLIIYYILGELQQSILLQAIGPEAVSIQNISKICQALNYPNFAWFKS